MPSLLLTAVFRRRLVQTNVQRWRLRTLRAGAARPGQSVLSFTAGCAAGLPLDRFIDFEAVNGGALRRDDSEARLFATNVHNGDFGGSADLNARVAHQFPRPGVERTRPIRRAVTD